MKGYPLLRQRKIDCRDAEHPYSFLAENRFICKVSYCALVNIAKTVIKKICEMYTFDKNVFMKSFKRAFGITVQR